MDHDGFPWCNWSLPVSAGVTLTYNLECKSKVERLGSNRLDHGIMGSRFVFVILRGSVFQLVWGWDCCPFSPFCMFGKSGMALLSIKLGTSFCWICNRNLKFSRLVMATAAMQQSALWILNDIDITDMSDITMETVWGTAWIASAPAILGLGRCGASKSRGILPPTSRRMPGGSAAPALRPRPFQDV